MNSKSSKAASGEFLGVAIGRRSLEELLEEVEGAVDGGRKVVFACANPHSLVVAQEDRSFLSALNNAGHVVADGVGVTIAAWLLGIDVGPRITGSDYFRAVMDRLDRKGKGRVFFFGSSPPVLELIEQRFAREYGGLTFCGSVSPPFRDWSEEENREMVEAIASAKPDVLWVGMTAPKQEKWVERNRKEFDIPVIGSIGAVFDYYAGTSPRSPAWMRAVGLEWLYRLAREPKRLWKRSLRSSPRFIGLAMRRHLFGRR